MARTVALADPASRLGGLLAAKGYKLVGLQEARRFRAHVDAILYTGYRPEASGLTAGLTDSAGARPASDDLPCAIMLDVTGLDPQQAAAELEYRLQRRGWRW